MISKKCIFLLICRLRNPLEDPDLIPSSMESTQMDLIGGQQSCQSSATMDTLPLTSANQMEASSSRVQTLPLPPRNGVNFSQSGDINKFACTNVNSVSTSLFPDNNNIQRPQSVQGIPPLSGNGRNQFISSNIVQSSGQVPDLIQSAGALSTLDLMEDDDIDL